MEEYAKDVRPESYPEMAQPVAREGTSASTQADAEITDTRVLARVPALDAGSDCVEVDRPSTDGRILGQSVSTKILLGVAVCFVGVATVTWLGGLGGSNSGGGMTPPDPNAPPAPLYSDNQSTPGPTQPASTMPPIDELNFEATVPDRPAWADAPPKAMAPTQPSAVAETRTPIDATPVTAVPVDVGPASDASQSAPTWQPPADIPRVSERPTKWGDRPAPSSPGSEPMSSAWPRPSTPYGEPSVRPNRQDMVPERVAAQHVAAIPVEYRDRYSSPSRVGSATQPGVARLEGTIEKPAFRTTDDRARSSVY